MTTQAIPRILFVDDDEDSRHAMLEWTRRRGWEGIAVKDGEAALQHMYDGIAVIVTDLKMPRTDGMELLRIARDRAPHAAVLMVSGVAGVEVAVEALRAGAYDFLTKPVDLDKLQHRIEQAMDQWSMSLEIAELHRQLRERHGIDNMIGQCAPMRELFENSITIRDSV